MIDYQTLSDEELISFYGEDDCQALEVLTDRYMKKALIIAHKLSVPADEISDFVQEGMIGFLSAVHFFNTNRRVSFSTFASTCIKNRMLSELRSSGAKRKVPKELIVSYDEQPGSFCVDISPEEYLISEKNAQDIIKAIGELSQREQAAFKLYLAGHSYCEIAEKLSVSEKAVDGTLQRARKKLRGVISL